MSSSTFTSTSTASLPSVKPFLPAVCPSPHFGRPTRPRNPSQPEAPSPPAPSAPLHQAVRSKSLRRPSAASSEGGVEVPRELSAMIDRTWRKVVSRRRAITSWSRRPFTLYRLSPLLIDLDRVIFDFERCRTQRCGRLIDHRIIWF